MTESSPNPNPNPNSTSGRGRGRSRGRGRGRGRGKGRGNSKKKEQSTDDEQHHHQEVSDSIQKIPRQEEERIDNSDGNARSSGRGGGRGGRGRGGRSGDRDRGGGRRRGGGGRGRGRGRSDSNKATGKKRMQNKDDENQSCSHDIGNHEYEGGTEYENNNDIPKCCDQIESMTIQHDSIQNGTANSKSQETNGNKNHDINTGTENIKNNDSVLGQPISLENTNGHRQADGDSNNQLQRSEEKITPSHKNVQKKGNKGQGKGQGRKILKRELNETMPPPKATSSSSKPNQQQLQGGQEILGIAVTPAPHSISNSTTTKSSARTTSTNEEKKESHINRIDSVLSLPISEKSATEKDAKAGSAGVIDLLKNKKKSKKEKRESKKDSTGGKKKKTKGAKGKTNQQQGYKHDDEIANQRAAKAFNSAVRKSVERSDPDALYDLLHDKRNHKFALHADVLEMVLKAFVVAAMFDEALYCCTHCTRTGTLGTNQSEKILQCLPQNLRNSSAYVAADMINALCIATKFDKPTHRTYFMRIVRGIALEFLEEATSSRDRICSAPCERLVRSSICVVNAELKKGKKATDIIVVPGRQLGVFIPNSMENRGIQAGDAVGILPYGGPYPMSAESLDRNMIEATVTGIKPMILRLQDKTNASLHAMLTEQVEGNVYRIDKLANRMGFNRQLSAAVALSSPLEKDINGLVVPSRSDTRRPSPELIRAITAMDENIDRAMIGGNVPRNNNNTGLTSTAAICAQPVSFYTAEDDMYGDDDDIRHLDQRDEDSIRDAARLALEKYGSFEGLNASQRLAVEGAATNRLTLVQGPPGTGKTAVAIRIMEHWARLASSEALPGQYPKPILATSDSNIAVDNLVEGCANAGLKVVRLGRPEAIRPELLRYCIDRPQQNNRSQNNGDVNNMFNGGQNSYASIFKEKIKALKSAQVICCTCIGSGADILDNMIFERVLVDEATQATEPAVLVPLTRLCRQLVLVGDHCQLPPTVLSTRAEEEGLGVPLFSRMVACGVPPFMLDTQYRMHPSLAMFPSDLFYGGKLLNGVSAPERRPLAGFPWPREEFPVAFVPVPLGIEVDDGVSKMNEAEAAAACDAVEALLKGGQCTTSDIAVVTPYAAQVRLIRRLTRKLVDSPPYVEVSSTDGFQGREKEAVVFSAVRSNDYGSVGFVSDWRRVNVSFTRARRGLIVIGNDVTLRRGDPETWMPWLAWADAHGINMDKPGQTRGRYDAEQLRRVRGGTTAAEMLKDVLQRQQAQLQKAEKQIKNAQKKSSGQIVGGPDSVPDDKNEDVEGATISRHESELSLKNDLALLSNAEGFWDESDEEDTNDMQHSASAATFSSMISLSSNNSKPDEPEDDW